MATALVAGSTGLIGEQLVQQLLNNNQYSNVITLVRKPTTLQHPKLTEVVVDFNALDKLTLGADHLYCCLGTTINTAGSKAAFIKVDRDYIVNFARLGKANSATKFALVSSMSADTTSKIFYSRVKGQTEAAVTAIGYDTCLIFRPSLLLGKRKQFRLGESVGIFLESIFRFAIPKKYRGIQASQVAKAMIAGLSGNNTGNQIIESNVIAEM